MKHLIIPVALALMSTGCVNGKLSPLVAPIVEALDVAACEVLPLVVSGSVVGEACSAVASTVNGFLTAFSAPSAKSAVLPKALAKLTILPAVPLKMNGHTIGHVHPEFAPKVQKQLDAVPTPTTSDAGVEVPDSGLL